MRTPKPIVGLIQTNQQRRDPVLDLRDQTLRQVPEEIRGLDHLEQLLLGQNAIQTLPGWLTDLPRMQFIQLNQNPLLDVGEVRNLMLDQGVWWRLRPDPTQVAGLWLRWEPGELLEVAKKLPLRWLDLSGQRLRECPREIALWPTLRHLVLRSNRLDKLPPEIGQLQNLSSLDLRNNGLSTLLPEIGELQNLFSLDLRNNGLSALPPEIGELQNLSSLDLRNNGLSGLPPEIGELQNLSSLDLRNNGLSGLPPEIGELQNLSSLGLSSNQFSALPLVLCQLQNLSSLSLSSNQFSALPPEIGQLQNLSSLNLNSNCLSALPPEIGQLQNLSSLNLNNNSLSALPPEIGELQNLSLLGLSSNKFSALPLVLCQLQNLSSLGLSSNQFSALSPEIGQLQNLSSLNLNSNRLSALPPEIGQLQNLSSLNLNNNTLSALPPEIDQLQNFITLTLIGNKIKVIPSEIGKLHDLRILDLENNPVEMPPLESLDLETGYVDLTKLRAWFRQAEEVKLDYLYEAKLIIVEEGGAGKTSLARRILNAEADLPVQDESTRGIDILRWEFPLPGPFRKQGEKERSTASAQPSEEQGIQKNFRVNIWDFGGQQIYHATHQFFLTKRSLYALVAESRKEDHDFYGWLNRIELFSEESPVFIVKNRKFGRAVEFDEASLRERFGNLHNQAFDCDLGDNQGLDGILDFIRFRIQQLPHVGQALPKTWLKVRETLENDPRNYLSLAEYLEVCQQHGFQHRADALQLSDYLHDLGVFLHFQDDELLKRTIILKPTWGTDAVYKVLDSDQVCCGRFTEADLKKIWHEEQYEDMRAELLRLIMQFKLCYELPDPGHYIAPQLLPKTKPAYEPLPEPGLQLSYTYPRFMPKGILTRFIVAVHPMIEQQRECVWQTGVVVGHDASRAEIREDLERREIRLQVTGRHRRDLLTQLVYELEKIHATLHGLEYQRMIPCHCEVCAGRKSPHFYRYDTLRRYRDRGKKSIECEESLLDVEVRGLLDDVGETDLPGQRHVRGQRDAVLGRLADLLDAQFEEVWFKFAMPRKYRRGEVTFAQHGMDLVRYAEQQQRLDELMALVEKFYG